MSMAAFFLKLSAATFLLWLLLAQIAPEWLHKAFLVVITTGVLAAFIGILTLGSFRRWPDER
jgi:hypothetical protein